MYRSLDPRKVDPTAENTYTVRQDAQRYLRAHTFLSELKRARPYITREQLLTLRGQALNGDVDGAVKGLAKIMGRNLG